MSQNTALEAYKADPQIKAPSSRDLVSIVIITYNHASLLPDALASATCQGGAPIEIIVVDDGSSDDPDQVVRRFAGVRLIRQKNSGPSAARNVGWRAARGSYVVFLDADDRLLPDAVSNNLHQLQQHPDCAFVHGFYRSVDVDWNPLPTPPQRLLTENAFEELLFGNPLAMPAVMFRRKPLEEVGGFDERYRGSEDYDLYLRLARNHPAFGSSSLVAECRRHDRNSSSNTPMMFRSALAVLSSQRDHASSRAAWRVAYRAGMRNLTDLYIRIQLRQFRDVVAGREKLGRATSSAIRVLTIAPLGSMGSTLRILAGEYSRLGAARRPI
jgi:glycosyltransferase involved in cell wall biosynthesis